VKEIRRYYMNSKVRLENAKKILDSMSQEQFRTVLKKNGYGKLISARQSGYNLELNYKFIYKSEIEIDYKESQEYDVSNNNLMGVAS
jgi:hypothetical protein